LQTINIDDRIIYCRYSIPQELLGVSIRRLTDMKLKLLLILVISLIIAAFTACGSSVVPVQNSAVTETASVLPSPDQSSSEAPKAADSVQSFYDNPQKFLKDSLEPLLGMPGFLSGSGLVSAQNDELFTSFTYNSYSQPSNSDDITKTEDISYYDMTVTANETEWDIDKIAEKVTSCLGIKYKDAKMQGSSGDDFIYKTAAGEKTGYSDSRIYYDFDDYVRPDTAKIFFSYGKPNDIIHSLVEDSFSRGIVSVPDILSSYKQTYGITYCYNDYLGETENKVGCVKKNWWNISKEDAGELDKIMKDNGFVDTDHEDGFQIYYKAFKDDYFAGAEVEINNYGTDNKPYYIVDFSIYYKAN
jgi:hypothetical protein